MKMFDRIILLAIFGLLLFQNRSIFFDNHTEKLSNDYAYYNMKKHFVWLDKPIYYFIKEQSAKKNISPILICSIIHWESAAACNYNLKRMRVVKSRAGAIGLMQIMPVHAQIRNRPVKKLKEPFFNIRCGVDYLDLCIKKSKGNLKEALRMYNQGINAKRYKYKNWKYVFRVIKKFNSVK